MSEKIAELEARLAQAQTQREKIDSLNNLTWELVRYREAERAEVLIQQAHDLSTSGEFSTQPYEAGLAASLTIRAYLDRVYGKYDLALAGCFRSLALLGFETISRTTVDSLRLLGWIYLYLGDETNALRYSLKALNLAQAGNFKDKEAAVLDGLARIYAGQDDAELARQAHTKALEIAQDLDDKMLETVALNNCADTLCRWGEYERALELGNQSLKIALELGINQLPEIYDTLGQILIQMGEYARAETLLNQSLAADRAAGEEMGMAFSYYSLGELHFAQSDWEQAEASFKQSLDLAAKVGARPIQQDCHEKLAGLAEQQQDWAGALAHHKAFHALYRQAHSESANQRMAVLKVAHQVETAKREAEIYQQRNEELLREIEERKKAEKALEELAMTDPLTGLFNRRHFFRMAEFLLADAVRYHRALSVMVLDIDFFKRVNDTYGHATGDEAIKLLAETIKSIIRATDIAARFGGDEFVLLMPETDNEQALKTALRLRLSLAERIVSTSQRRFHVTLSVGVASISEEVNSIDTLLEQADRALYAAKQNGRNQVQVYQKPSMRP